MFHTEFKDTFHTTPLPDICNGSTNELDNTATIVAWLKQLNQEIDVEVNQGTNIRTLVKAKATAIDELLINLFKYFNLHHSDLTLFAIGGYGRGTLSLHSDVDIMILAIDQIDSETSDKVQQFIRKLWDIGIEPALATRTIQECSDNVSDHTIATALLEARFLCGDDTITSVPQDIVNKYWSPKDFYHVKLKEAQERYKKNNSTEYNLEPDVKKSPGGLRDIHVIGWVSKRYFHVNKLFDLVQQDFLTEREFDDLIKAENFLWTIRYHLHSITGRDENRLLFEYQRNVATRMGYDKIEQIKDSHGNASIENFMRDYYRCAMMISTLSEMLVSHYYECLIEPHLPQQEKPKSFQINELFTQFDTGANAQIAISHDKVFAQTPSTILQMFVLMGQQGIKRVRADTLRALKVATRGIDNDFRNDPNNKKLFIDNLKHRNYLYHRLLTMKRYGILGSYLPAFSKVTGLMQYDLFHSYTVDTHTLLLVRFLHRFTDETYATQFELVGSIYQAIKRKEILMIAVLFHDIAKGRGGDHSELGEVDALEFCQSHGVNDNDSKLIAWLVKYHLLMSITAQKKDIDDPLVVHKFAKIVGNLTYLNHLYVLTVADMNATNSQIWNSWRATLMKKLYLHTRQVLHADLESPVNREQMIRENREQAEILLETIDQQNIADKHEIIKLWDKLGDEYFLKEIPADIIWHSQEILKHLANVAIDNNQPLIALREHSDLALDAIQIFIYTPNQNHLFNSTVSVFNKMDLDVMDARIITDNQNFALDSYIVMDKQDTLLESTCRQNAFKDSLIDAFNDPSNLTFSTKYLPQSLRHFNVPTKVYFKHIANTQHHKMNLNSLDKPNLLAQISQLFWEQNIEVHSARITTLGEKAKDMFFISDKDNKLLSEKRLAVLKERIIDVL